MAPVGSPSLPRAPTRRGVQRRTAAELLVSPSTAETHVAHVLAELDARDRVQAVIAAHEAGLAGG